MEELQEEIARLQQENEALRHRLEMTNRYLDIYVKLNTELEHQLRAVNGHFTRSIKLFNSLMKIKGHGNITAVYSQAYHLLNRN